MKENIKASYETSYETMYTASLKIETPQFKRYCPLNTVWCLINHTNSKIQCKYVN